MSKHIETRRKLRDIPSLSRFDDLIEQSTLSDEDKELLRLHYLQNKDFGYIGDMQGYSEVTIKRHHARALSKLSKLI